MAAATAGRLSGKTGAIFGFASTKSIAWGIAEAWNREGCTLTISISSDRFRAGLEKATGGWSHKPHIVVCDVSSDTSLAECWTQIAEKHQGKLDLLTHSIAYATKPAMQNPLLEISRDDYLSAHSISSYSLIALSRHAAPLMDAAIEEKKSKRNMEKEVDSSNSSSATQKENDGKVVTSATTIKNVLFSSPPSPSPPITGSIIALSYLGSQRTVPSYRVMGPAKASLEATARQLAVELGGRGIRVNVVSPGPIDTLAARGIQGFTTLREAASQRAPLGRGVTITDVGELASFLASDSAAGITGQTLYVDSGISILA